MSLIGGIVVFSITWFVVLFTVLPWGVRTQQEDDHVAPGTVESAPVNPAIWKKMLATTIITGILFGIFLWTVEYGIIDYRSIVNRNA
ncbi:DUF1467 family protein [Sneathiella chinensis]|uniref:Membrane protein n=1 Tax=Sneathiella chinensis TaxID=349750 RepID=A0ABQ5U646_9PROT|nr:DUF1467 family protein [Sneathiella chinensis]GLQ07183.1 membrane protein [Sneathiella chinensis]